MATDIPKKVLVVRFSSIGDIVLCSPVVRCVKKQWNAEVHFITKVKFANVIAASPYVDRVITIEEKVAEVAAQLAAENYDLVIDLHKNIRSQQVRAATGASYRTFDKLNVQKWLTVHTPLRLLKGEHIVDRYFSGLVDTGLTNDGLGLDHFVDEQSTNKAKALTPEYYVAINLGATYYTKRLPVEQLARLVSMISKPIVLLGGPDVKDAAAQLEAATEKPLINLVGTVSLAVSSAVVAHAAYVVSGDSGLMHMAAAHRRPLIVPWGSTHTSLGMYPYYPKGEKIPYAPLSLDLHCQPCSKIGKAVCPKGHFNCMLNITEGMMQAAVAKMEAR